MEFKETLNLPKTDFPMKADLPQKEERYLASWKADNLYQEYEKKAGDRPAFILHDGPPYANGNLHMGHALNKILKDIINRVAIKKGRRISYIPGWDCHGLPIEHKVLKDLGKRRGDLSDGEIRAHCRKSAETFSRTQAEEFLRMGIFGNFEKPYLTMDWGYEADILRQLGKMVEQERVYKGEKPVLWCGFCETALADAEVEYAPHRSTTVTVLFVAEVAGNRRHYPIWTTTPWTLPANQAVAVGGEIPYAILEATESFGPLKQGEEIIIAKEIYEHLGAQGPSLWFGLGGKTKVKAVVTGERLVKENPRLQHPVEAGRTVPLVVGDFVGTDQGTGLVHIAPGHGEDDFHVGEAYGLSRETPVDERGRYGEKIRNVDTEWVGKKIGEIAPLMTGFLEREGRLLGQAVIEHSYPHCWRCKNPVYYRATSQWFLSLERKDLREKTLKAIGEVRWIPEKGENRIRGMIETRPDWCLSRQRAWGVPIPAIFCRTCGKTSLQSSLITKVADKTEKEGLDFWFDEAARKLFLKDERCPHCNDSDIEREKDILDVWFDSGVSHEAVLKKRSGTKWPADLYLEGSDQHRGWFHSSLLTSMAIEGVPPYKAVLTHGFVVDGQGRKMAKTLGNVISPKEITDKYGADVLRLWAASADYQEDTRLSSEIVNNTVDSYRKIRNTIRFMLSNLYDYSGEDQARLEEGDPLDHWVLSVWENTKREIIAAYDDKQFAQVISHLNNFCSVTLSAQYFDIAKDRLYAEHQSGRLRRGTQHTLRALLDEMLPLLHPVLPFTTTEIFLHDRKLESPGEAGLNVLMQPFPALFPNRVNKELEEAINRLLAIRSALGKISDELKKDKAIKTTMDLHIDLTGAERTINPLGFPSTFLEAFFIVSGLSLNSGRDKKESLGGEIMLAELDAHMTLSRAEGAKCERCWLIRKETGSNQENWPICQRCYQAIKAH